MKDGLYSYNVATALVLKDSDTRVLFSYNDGIKADLRDFPPIPIWKELKLPLEYML